MHIHEWLFVCIMTRRTKNFGGTKLSLQQEVSHFPISSPFWSISMPRTLINSSYRLNTTDFQFTQYHLQPWAWKLSPMSNMVGVMVRSIFMLSHKASSPCNFNIQFPMYTKFITQVYDVILITSMHQYNAMLCHIYSATYWTQEFRLQDNMQLQGEHTVGQRFCQSIIKTQLTTNSFEGFF